MNEKNRHQDQTSSLALTKHGVLQMIQPDKGSHDQEQQQQQQQVEPLQVLLRVDPNNYTNVTSQFATGSSNFTSRMFSCTISDQEHILTDAIVYIGPDVEHHVSRLLLVQRREAWAAVVSVKAYITSQCNICRSSSSSSSSLSSNDVLGSNTSPVADNCNTSTSRCGSSGNNNDSTASGSHVQEEDERKRPFVCITSFDVLRLFDASMAIVGTSTCSTDHLAAFQHGKENKEKQQEEQTKDQYDHHTVSRTTDPRSFTDLSSLSHPPRSFKVTSGKIGSFVLRDAWLYTNEELAGLETSHVSETARLRKIEDIDMVSSFLSNHGAMVTISDKVSCSTTISAYFAALKEFSEVQNKRQNASLVSNSGREDMIRSGLVERNYAATLALVLAHARFESRPKLTVKTLCHWHSVLGEGGLIKDAGILRKKPVRAGFTTFCHCSVVESELENLLMGLEEFERRLLTVTVRATTAMGLGYDSKERRNYFEGYGPILFAAMAMFGVVDIHPFSDGNGRLSRLIANWALARAGFPFTVNLFATPAQRRRYVTATEMTRRNTNMIARGTVSLEILSAVRRHVGPFKPMFDLVLSVCVKAITECRKLIDDMDRSHLEEEELRAARRYRERAAAGSCLICLEDGPNIATLCCGKAVHLNCIAQWLSNNRTCPQCRSDLPSLPPAVASPAIRVVTNVSHGELMTTTDDTDLNENVDDIDDTTSTYEDDVYDTTSTHEDDVYDTTSTHEEDMYDTTTSTHEENIIDTTSTIQDTTMDDTTSTNEETTMDDTSIDDTTTTHVAQQQYPIVCRFGSCSNRAALDCSNDYCGRCCQFFGHYSCERHNR